MTSFSEQLLRCLIMPDKYFAFKKKIFFVSVGSAVTERVSYSLTASW